MPLDRAEEFSRKTNAIYSNLGDLERMADELDQVTQKLVNFCDEAKLGDQHNYLKTALAHSYDTIAQTRIAEAELRSIIRNLFATVITIDKSK